MYNIFTVLLHIRSFDDKKKIKSYIGVATPRMSVSDRLNSIGRTEKPIGAVRRGWKPRKIHVLDPPLSKTRAAK